MPDRFPCWVRQWLSRMNHTWFSEKAVRSIPREKRLETLQFIFADGFDSYRDMLKYGSRAQRMAGFWVRAFIRHPSMRWAAERFFRIYFRLASRNNGQREGFRKQVDA